ncbi:MAG: YwaF family protein [Oscillospiraceae bacterium]|nr:YwaF family protein [Oscillospiraceae bacterium]
MQLWEKEQVYTLLPAIGVMLILAFVLHKTLGNKSEQIRRIPLQIITVILLGLEVVKQLCSILKGYDLYHLPFHYCSLFLYVMPFMAFYKGKYKREVDAIGFSISSALFLLMLIYPGLIYSGYNVQQYFQDVFSFHTVTFHNLAMFGFLVIIVLKLHTPYKGDYKPVIGFMLLFSLVAAVMAQVLKTNYANFYTCNIPPLEAVRLSVQAVLGKGVTQLLYVLIVAALQTAFTLMTYYLFCKLENIFAARKKAVNQAN